MLTVIDYHSVDLDLLTPGSVVLDVGCRGFRFTEFFAQRWNRVIALDPGEDSNAYNHPYVKFLKMGLAPTSGTYKLVLTQDPEARYTVPENEEVAGSYFTVKCLDLTGLMQFCNVTEFALMKLNMEGGEFDILDQLHAPVAEQIVVSFHEHTPRKRGQAAIDGLIQKLGKWYNVVRHEWDERYCAGRNAWDTVLKRR